MSIFGDLRVLWVECCMFQHGCYFKMMACGSEVSRRSVQCFCRNNVDIEVQDVRIPVIGVGRLWVHRWSRSDVATSAPPTGTTARRSCMVIDNGIVEEPHWYCGTGCLFRRRQLCGYSQQCSRKQEQRNGGCGPQAGWTQRQYRSEERTPNR